MKRLILLTVLVLTALILTACSQPPTVSGSFTADFTALREGKEEYSGTVSRDDTTLSVVMSEPYTVSGTVFEYSGGELYIRSRGHCTTADSGYLPEGSLPSVLRDSLSYLDQAVYTGSSDGADAFSLPTPDGEAKLLARNGFPVSLEDAESGWRIDFGKQ